MSLIQRYVDLYAALCGWTDSALIREVSHIQSVLYREVPLYVTKKVDMAPSAAHLQLYSQPPPPTPTPSIPECSDLLCQLAHDQVVLLQFTDSLLQGGVTRACSPPPGQGLQSCRLKEALQVLLRGALNG